MEAPRYATLEALVDALHASGRMAGLINPDLDDRRRIAAVISDVLGVEARVPSDCRIERLADAAAAIRAGTATWRETASQRALTDGRIAGLYVYTAK